jgi:NTP pyrophosphatase (non-canonical NTP hydrolase)
MTQLTPTYLRTEAERDDLRRGLNDAQDAVFAVNEANGWFEDDRTFGDDVALLHSEVSEMLEAYRDHGYSDMTDLTLPGDTRLPKPEGVGSEAADILIRLLDTCARRGINLAFEFERKLEFNSTRGHKHGGKVM